HLDRQFEVEERSHEQRHERREREREAVVADDASASDNPFAALSGLVLDEAPEVVSPEPDSVTDDSSLPDDGDDSDDGDEAMSPEPADDSSMRVVEAETKGDMQRALAVMTIIEAVQESPGVVINAQLRKAKDEVMAEMKSSGVEYEERMERLAKVEPPRPMKDWMYADFNEFRARHPWVGGNTVKPKSIARDMFERSMTFGEYTGHYGLKQSEGVLLRYLSDVYKGITQNVPADAMNDELDEIAHWLGTLVRQVDSSLLDEWERLQNPDEYEVVEGAVRPPTAEKAESGEVTITSDRRAFNTMVRNAAFRWIEQLARHERPKDSIEGLNARALMEPYWDEYDAIETDGDARNASRFDFDARTGQVSQTIHDPEGHDEWHVSGAVDLPASRVEDRLVIALTGLHRR
ncbi:MAG: hypothetical protein ACI8RE_003043, partial [Ilumatobacter sp.]